MTELYVGEIFKSGGKSYRVLAFEKFNPNQPRDSFAKAFNPDEPRDKSGKWTGGTEAFRSYYKQAAEFVHGKTAKEVLADVAKSHKVQTTAKDAVSMAISSILTYVTKQQFNDVHVDEFIKHLVDNLGIHVEISKDKSKALLKDSVKALMDVRKRGKKEIEKLDDPVLEVLTMLSELLDKGDEGGS